MFSVFSTARRASILAVAVSALCVPVAHAYEVHISITGAGTVTETTPANLVGTGCTTSANNPTGTVGVHCYPGDVSGDYGYLWDVDYVATPKSGYRFVQWQSDGSATSAVICDRSSPAATTSTYTGATCKFRTVDNLQTRAVFEDVTNPAMASLNGPNQAVNGATTFTFSATADPTLTGFECRVANVHDWVGCSSGRSEDPATSGDYTFEVRAVDASGNRSSVSTWPWTVDKLAPSTTLATSGPSGLVNTNAASFSFSSSESGSFACSLNGGVYASCTSPTSYTGLADGSYTFSVRAQDVAGNHDATPESRTWTVDTTAPETTLDASGPNGSTTDTSAQFTFSSNEGGASFTCQLDGGASESCSSPRTYSGLAVGEHTVTITATDAAGNTDASPASRTWTVTAPAVAPIDLGGGTSTTNTTSTTNNTTSGEAGGSTPGSTSGGPVAEISGPAVATRVASRTGVFTLPNAVSCPAACKVAVTATGNVPTAARAAAKLVFAKASFTLLTGGKRAIKLKLTRKGRAALKRMRKARLTVAIKLTPAGSTSALLKTVRLTLKAR